MVNRLLSRLRKVRKTGRDQWVACCPAHDDKHPSLAVRLTDDGKILIHCFSGCEALEVLDSIGLDFSDLFTDDCNFGDGKNSLRRPFNARTVLRALRWELMIAALATQWLANGKELTSQDRERLALAAARIHEAIDAY